MNAPFGPGSCDHCGGANAEKFEHFGVGHVHTEMLCPPCRRKMLEALAASDYLENLLRGVMVQFLDTYADAPHITRNCDDEAASLARAAMRDLLEERGLLSREFVANAAD